MKVRLEHERLKTRSKKRKHSGDTLLIKVVAQNFPALTKDIVTYIQ